MPAVATSAAGPEAQPTGEPLGTSTAGPEAQRAGEALGAVQAPLREARGFDAVDASVPLARQFAAEFATGLGAAEALLDRIRLAISEAATNVVRHAYRGPGGTFQLSLALCGDELWALVSDDGCGHQTPSADPGLGLGLALMAQACDEFVITERATGGTEVQMRFRLRAAQPPV